MDFFRSVHPYYEPFLGIFRPQCTYKGPDVYDFDLLPLTLTDFCYVRKSIKKNSFMFYRDVFELNCLFILIVLNFAI